MNHARQSSTFNSFLRFCVAPLLYLVFLIAFCSAPDSIPKVTSLWMTPDDSNPLAVQLSRLDEKQVKQLLLIQSKLEAVDELNTMKRINGDVNEIRQMFLNKSVDIVGYVPSPELLKAITVQEGFSQSTWEKFAGLFTFVNIIWVVAIILCLVAISLTCGIWILPAIYQLLLSIPISFYELLAYFVAYQFVVCGTSFRPGVDHFIALTGCLAQIPCLGFSASIHLESSGGNLAAFIRLNQTYLTLCWGMMSIFYDSRVIGFATIIILVSLLGFSVHAWGLGYSLGFESTDAIPTCMISCLVLLGFYGLLHVFNLQIKFINLRPFSTGALFMGSFVYYLGLLIVSSKHHTRNQGTYIAMQFVTIVSGIAAILIGNVYDIRQLSGIGGTFFMLYLLEKYLELPWGDKSFLTFGLLGVGLILYGFSLFVSVYPQYLLSIWS